MILNLYLLAIGVVLLMVGLRIRVAPDDASPIGVLRRSAKYAGLIGGPLVIVSALRMMILSH
jgi:hypothetical protein